MCLEPDSSSSPENLLPPCLRLDSVVPPSSEAPITPRPLSFVSHIQPGLQHLSQVMASVCAAVAPALQAVLMVMGLVSGAKPSLVLVLALLPSLLQRLYRPPLPGAVLGSRGTMESHVNTLAFSGVSEGQQTANK